MAKAANYMFSGVTMGFSSSQELDEETGETVTIWTLAIIDPDEPATYRVSFRDEMKTELVKQLQDGIVPAGVADLRALAQRGAHGLPKG